MSKQRLLKQTLLLIPALLAVALILGWGYPNNSPRIAYVSIQKLLYHYEGMQEAKVRFDQEKQEMLTQMDSLKLTWERSLNTYQNDKDERMAAIAQQQEQHYRAYAQGIARKIEEKDKAMMQSVLNQVNSFIEKFAQEQGYDIILGTDGTGNLLYGNKEMDITETLTQAINQEYKGR